MYPSVVFVYSASFETSLKNFILTFLQKIAKDFPKHTDFYIKVLYLNGA